MSNVIILPVFMRKDVIPYPFQKNGGSNCEKQIIPENRKEFGDRKK